MGMHPAMRKHNEFNYPDGYPPTLCALAELALAITIPVTHASKQENSTMSRMDTRMLAPSRGGDGCHSQPNRPGKHESFPSITFPVEEKPETV